MAAQTREFPITFTMASMESIVVIATPAGSEAVFVVMASNVTQLLFGNEIISQFICAFFAYCYRAITPSPKYHTSTVQEHFGFEVDSTTGGRQQQLRQTTINNI